MKCPSFENLIDLVDGRLAADTVEAVRAHLATGCRPCNASRSWYEQARAIATDDDTVEPPTWVFNRAVRLFETHRPARHIAARVGKLIAALVFDSRQQTALAGVRSTAAGGRQLLYRAEDYSIDLQIAAISDERTAMSGQLLREGEMHFESVARRSLALLREGNLVLATETNERGEFTMNDLDAGEYDLRIDANEADITILGLPMM